MTDPWEPVRMLARVNLYLMERAERDFDALDIVMWAMIRCGMDAAKAVS